MDVDNPMLVAHFISNFCSTHPEQLFARVIDVDKDTSLDGSGITAGQLLAGGQSASGYLQASSGLSENTSTNVSILARSGYDYLVNFIGISLNHWTPVLISTRNSLDAIIELVRASDSRCLFVDEFNFAVGEQVLKQVEGIKVVKLYGALKNVNTSTSPNDKQSIVSQPDSTTTMSADEPALFLHSSGTTGHPKLIPIPHRIFLQRLCRVGDAKYVGHPSLAPVPFFHTMGLQATLGFTMAAGTYALMIESNKPVTGEVMARLLRKYPNCVSLAAPATLLDMLQAGDSAIDVLRSAHRIMYAGAALPPEIGNKLASHGVKVMALFGTTETGGLVHSDLPSNDLKDWEYFKFINSPDIVLIPVDGASKVVQIHVKPGEFLPPTFIDPNDPYGYTSGDIFEQHPSNKDLWKHAGRKSSVTVLVNGEKTDNGQLEKLLQEDPLISLAVVFGTGRFQNGVILLPAVGSSVKDEEAFLDAIWGTVERANTIIPQHSRLVRRLVLMASAAKGFSLTDKGTVRRNETLQLYKEEIDAAYDALESEIPRAASDLPQPDNRDAVLEYIRQAVTAVMRSHIGDNEDFFDKGMDSLSALTVRSSLLQIIFTSRPNINVPRNLVYHYPTIAHLAEFICPGSTKSEILELDSKAMKMDRLVKMLTKDISEGKGFSNTPFDSGSQTVVLTGSTGTFGTQILATLVQHPHVDKVICLNRAHPTLDILQRHRLQLDNPGLFDEYRDKLVFATMDVSQVDLGIDGDILKSIRTSATSIIHCAWDINFNHPLEHFVDLHIAGTKHLAEIALSSERQIPPRFIFISSIASVGNYPGDSVPEQIFEDPTLPLEQGYGESKFVAERVIHEISVKSGLPSSIVRVGQLSGSTSTGQWNKNEYMFILLQSSIAIGKIPEWLPDVRWMPTDVAAVALVDILFSESSVKSNVLGASVYHLESPAVTLGSDLVQWSIELSGGALVPVSSSVWLEAICASPSKSASVKPAERLYDFFNIWLDKVSSMRTVALSTEKSVAISTAANCTGIGRELFAKYFEYAIRSS